MPPDSSKNRSNMTHCCVGTTPVAALELNILRRLSAAQSAAPVSCLQPAQPPRSTESAHALGHVRAQVGKPPPTAPSFAPALRLARTAPSAGARGRHRNRDFAAADVEDPPRRVPELEHVARLAFDGEVFVQCADECSFAFGDDAIVGLSGIAPPEVIAEIRACRRARKRW